MFCGIPLSRAGLHTDYRQLVGEIVTQHPLHSRKTRINFQWDHASVNPPWSSSRTRYLQIERISCTKDSRHYNNRQKITDPAKSDKVQFLTIPKLPRTKFVVFSSIFLNLWSTPFATTHFELLGCQDLVL